VSGKDEQPPSQFPPLVMSRVFPASPQLVFQAWSSAEHLRHWFCPAGYSVPEAHVEFKVGGAFDLCMRSADGQDHWMKGTYLEIVPYSRLVFESLAGPGHSPVFRAHTEVKFEEELGGNTRLTVRQTYTVLDASVAAPMIRGASQGWAQTLDRLEKEVIRIREGRKG
jgi:uncharacterized protein YndB with AHSA1/START domain